MLPTLPSVCICTIIEIVGNTVLLAPHSMVYARLIGRQFNFRIGSIKHNFKIGDVVYLSTTLIKSDTTDEEPVTMLVKYDKQNIQPSQSVELSEPPHITINDKPSDVDTIIDPLKLIKL